MSMFDFNPSPLPWRINRHGGVIDAAGAEVVINGAHDREVANACLVVKTVNASARFLGAQDLYDAHMRSVEDEEQAP